MRANIIDKVKHFAPDKLKIALKKIFFFGNKYFCPVCQSHVRVFYDFGAVLRRNVLCPVCGSLERHRMAWLFFENNTNLFDQTRKRMLHIAPEPQFERRLKKVHNLQYITAEFDSSGTDIQMDITTIPCVDSAFDIIYCSHVMEHVIEDIKGLMEFRRVLKPNGWAAIMVPIEGDTTFEDFSIRSPEERERAFGQHDHVRRYGKDFKNRLEKAGFIAQTINLSEAIKNQAKNIGAGKNEFLFLCTKRDALI